MDAGMFISNPILVVIPVATGVAILVWVAFRRLQREQVAAEAEARRQAEIERAWSAALPEGAVEIRAGGIAAGRDHILEGKLMLVFAGSFAASLGLRLLCLLDQCGLERSVGSILLIELDAWRRQDFLNRLPSVYADRVVVAFCAALPGGGKNLPIPEIDKLRRYWQPEIIEKAQAVCDRHQRRSQRSNEAAQVLPFISLGTTGYMGATAVAEIMRTFRAAQCVGFTAYPHHDRLRGRARAILSAYTKAGCHGYISADNLPDERAPERDLLVNDMGMVAIVVGLIAASRKADAVTESNNAFTLVLPEERGGIASYRSYLTSLPAHRHQPHPEVEPRFYVYGDATVSACLRALDEVEEAGRKAVGADYGHTRTSRFDLLLLPLEADSLTWVDDKTRHALQVTEPLPGNYDLFFAGVAAEIDPDLPTCSIVAVSVEALTDPDRHLDEVAEPLPVGRRTRVGSRPIDLTNGHRSDLDRGVWEARHDSA